MPTTYPTFYFEAAPRQRHGAAEQRYWGHPLWTLPNVVPEIAINNNNMSLQGQESIAALAADAINEYVYHNTRFTASGGKPMTQWALRIYPLGLGRLGSDPIAPGGSGTAISPWLMNHKADLLSGAPRFGGIPYGTGGYPGFATSYENSEFLSPFTASGIAETLAFTSGSAASTGFFPLLATGLVASGIPAFGMFALTTENCGWDDDVKGVYSDGSGWVLKALADDRGSSYLFDGRQSFKDWWNSVPEKPNGGVAVATGEIASYYEPERATYVNKWNEARKIAYDYARYKAIAEPMLRYFPTATLAEYLVSASSPTYPVPATYPGSPRYLASGFYGPAQGPDWYGSYPAQHNAQEDQVPPYWDSDYGWQTTYTRPASVTRFNGFEYAYLAYGLAKIRACQLSAPDKPVYVWVSDEYIDNDNLLYDFLIGCCEFGVTNFYVWNNDFTSSSGTSTYWYNMINSVNAYIDAMNSAQPATRRPTSTVARLAAGFYRF